MYGGEGRERAQDLAACTALGRVQILEGSSLAKLPAAAEPSSRDTFLVCAEVIAAVVFLFFWVKF